MTLAQKPRKSDRTRERIREAAGRLFATHGFLATSIRDIASEADCDPALVIRYFKSKEALFAEVSEFNLKLPDITNRDAREAARTLSGHFVRIWETPESGARFAILLRSSASHEPSAEKLRRIFIEQVLPAIAGSAPSAGDKERAGLVSSLLLGVAMSRHVLKLPPVAAMPQDRLIAYLSQCLYAILAKADTGAS